MEQTRAEIPSVPLLPERGDYYDRSVKIATLLKQLLVNAWQEEVWVFSLNSHLELIRAHLVFRGTADACPVHPRDVFRHLIADNATRFIIAHNHPSGRSMPSRDDLRFTDRLVKAGAMMEIPLLDHVIVSREQFYSFADHGRVKGPGTSIKRV